MKIFTKEAWNDIEEGKLTNDLTVEEFKNKFGISDDEYDSARKTSQSNEYGTIDLRFSDEEGDSIVAEYSQEEDKITHIYKH